MADSIFNYLHPSPLRTFVYSPSLIWIMRTHSFQLWITLHYLTLNRPFAFSHLHTFVFSPALDYITLKSHLRTFAPSRLRYSPPICIIFNTFNFTFYILHFQLFALSHFHPFTSSPLRLFPFRAFFKSVNILTPGGIPNSICIC